MRLSPARNFAYCIAAAMTAASYAYGQTEELPSESLSLWGLIQQGGWAMYPLGLCSLVMFFLILYAWKETRISQFIDTTQTFTPTVVGKNEEPRVALGDNLKGKTVLERALHPALKKVATNQTKADEVFIETLEAEENGIAQRINYLNVIASVSPMIGLLGTVSGMIRAFQSIGYSGMGRPELLAGDIGEALITTATGLIIGIPAMVAYFVMRNRLNTAMIRTAQAGSEVLDTLSERSG